MSGEALSWAWYQRGLAPLAKLALLALADNYFVEVDAADQPESQFFKIERLCDWLEEDEPTTRRALDELVAWGVIKCWRNERGQEFVWLAVHEGDEP